MQEKNAYSNRRTDLKLAGTDAFLPQNKCPATVGAGHLEPAEIGSYKDERLTFVLPLAQ